MPMHLDGRKIDLPCAAKPGSVLVIHFGQRDFEYSIEKLDDRNAYISYLGITGSKTVLRIPWGQ